MMWTVSQLETTKELAIVEIFAPSHPFSAHTPGIREDKQQTLATNCMALSSSLEIFFSLQSFIDWLQSSAANQKEATAHYLVRIFWALSCEAISLLFDPKATGNGYECPTCHGSWDSFFPRSIFNSLMNLHLLPVLKRTTEAYDS